jgi:hypothetical protein
MERYSLIKRNKPLIQTIAWMNLQRIIQRMGGRKSIPKGSIMYDCINISFVHDNVIEIDNI